MLGTEILVVTTALVTFISTVAAASCGAYICSRNDTNTIELLKEKKRVLVDLIDALKQTDNGEAVVTPAPSSLISRADAFFAGWDESIVKLEEGTEAKCIGGLIPNLWAQKQARVSMEKKFPKLNRLIEEAQSMFKKPVKGYKQLSGVSIVGRLRVQARDEIWNAISAETGTTICIHGAFGVGKTAIARYIHNKALETPTLFKYVIWVSLDYGASLVQVQESIAKSIGIAFGNPDYDTVERAQMLKNALLQKGKFLLVLDSMWHALSLEQIGIPELVDGRKLIITSRLRTICSKIRGKKMFEIKPLASVDQAWELFEREMGLIPEELDDEVLASTKSVVQELDGLPLAINKLAQILGFIVEQNPADLNRAWRKELASSKLESKDPDLLHRFKESYKNLREETRRCFQYCAIFPEDHLVLIENKVFMECLMWEGLLGDFETLEQGREKVIEVLTELKNAHLLLTEFGENVKMLNLVRSMAIEIMSESGNTAFVRSGSSITYLPLEHEWPAEVAKASFMQNRISALRISNRPKFNRLSVLLMQDNPLNLDNDEYFFYSMPNLRFLDMSRTNLTALPTSLSYLTNLTALLLCNCAYLRELPDLSKLQQVVVLDLSGTPLEQFPRGVEFMRKLRRLNLSETKLTAIPSKVFDQLIQLEELIMIGSYIWGTNQLEKQRKRACVEELRVLTKLTVLHLNLLNTEVLDKYLSMAETNTANLPPPEFRFHIVHTDAYVVKNSLAITGINDISKPADRTSELEITVISLLKLSLNVLDVSNFNALSYLFSVEILGSFTKLRELRVRSCENLVEVIQQSAIEGAVSFPELTKIVFSNLPNLTSVCCGQVFSCPKLRSIEVWKCERMKLPMIDSDSSVDMQIQVRGERSWLHNLKWDTRPGSSNPHFTGTPRSSSYLKFYRTTGPPESMLGTGSSRYVHTSF